MAASRYLSCCPGAFGRDRARCFRNEVRFVRHEPNSMTNNYRNSNLRSAFPVTGSRCRNGGNCPHSVRREPFTVCRSALPITHNNET
jgi:hypothetical protein